MIKTKTKRERLPPFKNEAEEARWWASRQGKATITRLFNRAAAEGTLHRVPARAKNISIRMNESDLNMARRQAAGKGLGYQTYIKMLLHEALSQAEGRPARS